MTLKEVQEYSKDLNILFVEDDLLVQKETLSILEFFFNKIEVANDGVEALDKYINYKKESNNYYDIIITDINMPNKDGIELISDINKINNLQPIIVMSAHSESNKLMELISLGISNFMTKPINMELLMTVIGKVTKDIYTNTLNMKLKLELNMKDNLLEERKKAHQEKLFTMEEIIKNISHHWRQPLSVITSSASTMLIKQELNTLDNETINNSCEHIIKLSQQISNIIDYIGNTVKSDEQKVYFNLTECINKAIVIEQPKLDESNIILINNFDENIELNTYENTLIQAIINILTNAIESLDKIDDKNKYIFIQTKMEDNKVVITIQDSANGINDEIINKIFEIYSTTKFNKDHHGLGMYITNNLINSLDGTIKALNSSISHKDIDYNSAKFIIELPI